MGITEVTVPKQYVLVQDTTPTGQFNGQIWFNESTATTSIFDNGLWKSLGIDLTTLENELTKEIAPIKLRTLILEAVNNLPFKDFDNGQADIFLTNNGISNTINTTDTTMNFYNIENPYPKEDFPSIGNWTGNLDSGVTQPFQMAFCH